MKISSNSLQYSNCYKPIEKKEFKSFSQQGSSNISFSSVKSDVKPYLTYKQKLFLNVQKPFAYVMGDVGAAKNYNLAQLEGIQKGISVFDGLSLKEICFIGDNLSSICTTQGCYSKCSHCYADAHKPVKEKDDYINTMSFEDFYSLVNGFKELKVRTGLDFIEKNQNSDYIALVFDADNLSVVLHDKNGKEHDFIELNKLLFDATGRRAIFDTSGWNIKSKKMQERADKLVEYYSKDENIDELYQFNLSINPFHSIYQKSIELEKKGYKLKAKELYDIYIDRMANAFLTFSSIVDKPNFGVIARAVEYDTEYIDEKALERILKDVEKSFKCKCIDDFNGQKKYIKTKEKLVDSIQNVVLDYKIIDTDLLLGKRLSQTMENFPVKNSKYNIYLPYLENLNIAESDYDVLKSAQRVKSVPRFYGKIIDVTGKVYLTDNYRVIPTDIQLNFKNKNKKADIFHTLVDDFVFTKNKI